MSFKRTKVVMLPTNEKAVFGFLTQKGKERGHLVHFDRPMPNILDSENQHIYITSDDEIKEGDWVLLANNSIVKAVVGKYELDTIIGFNTGIGNVVKRFSKSDRKIIATTDRLEIPYQFDKWSIIPQPSEGFIQKFVDAYNSGKPITEVNAEYEIDFMKASDPKFDLEPFEKLKVDPKDNTITIKKLKDSWTRDEVATLILQSNLDSHVAREGEFDIMHWIAENLV